MGDVSGRSENKAVREMTNRTYIYTGDRVRIESKGRPGDMKPSEYLSGTFKHSNSVGSRGKFEAAFCILRHALDDEKQARELYGNFYADCLHPRLRLGSYARITTEEIKTWRACRVEKSGGVEKPKQNERSCAVPSPEERVAPPVQSLTHSSSVDVPGGLPSLDPVVACPDFLEVSNNDNSQQ